MHTEVSRIDSTISHIFSELYITSIVLPTLHCHYQTSRHVHCKLWFFLQIYTLFVKWSVYTFAIASYAFWPTFSQLKSLSFDDDSYKKTTLVRSFLSAVQKFRDPRPTLYYLRDIHTTRHTALPSSWNGLKNLLRSSIFTNKRCASAAFLSMFGKYEIMSANAPLARIKKHLHSQETFFFNIHFHICHVHISNMAIYSQWLNHDNFVEMQSSLYLIYDMLDATFLKILVLIVFQVRLVHGNIYRFTRSRFADFEIKIIIQNIET